MKKVLIRGKLISLAVFIFLVAGAMVGYYGPQSALGADLVPALLTPDDYGAEANALQAKLLGPQMRVIFDKVSLKAGDSVSANAIPERFSVASDELYFTWYLKRDNGSDLDGDGDYDENDWKVEAMKIIAKNEYERQDGDYSRSTDDDGKKAFPRWDEEGDGSGDGDEYCYVQEYSSGRLYELTEVRSVFSTATETCSTDARCVATRDLTCSVEDLPDNPGIFQDVAKSACVETGAEARCESATEDDIENFRATVSCDANCGGSTFSSSQTELQICTGLGSEIDGSCDNITGIVSSCSFEKRSEGNFCKHLFPRPRGTGEETGDGVFGLSEESFWSTDPNNNSTANNGKLDEENIMGLGVDTFKWTYQSGDEVGVVVEGLSAIPTKHDNSGYMRTWAFSKNKCSAVEDADKKFYIENIFSAQAGILVVDELDLNDCLKENLIDPSGGNIGTLGVGLSYEPSNPMNDPESTSTFSRGDVVMVNASIGEVTSPSDLYYNWKIEASGDNTSAPANDFWIDITERFSERSYTEGIGLSKMNFKLNLSNSDLRTIFGSSGEDAYYIRVKATVSEGVDDDTDSRSGKGTAVIKFSNIGSEIVPYSVSVSGGRLDLDEPICNSLEEERSLCYVVRNEIIGLTVPDSESNLSHFKWKLNGMDLSCDSSMSTRCDNAGFTDTAFFPAVGAEGDRIEVTMETKETDTGITKELKRFFKIVEPAVVIKTNNKQAVWNKKLGFFRNMDGSVLEDVSAGIFQTSVGEDVSFVAQFHPSWISGNSSKEWSINGVIQEESSNNNVMNFRIDQEGGSIYNVEIDAEYMQSGEVRKALSDFWGISQENSGEKKMKHSIQVEVLENEYLAVSPFENPKLFMANLFSNLPEKAMFLVKLAITVIMLLLVVGVIFSIMPDFIKKD